MHAIIQMNLEALEICYVGHLSGVNIKKSLKIQGPHNIDAEASS